MFSKSPNPERNPQAESELPVMRSDPLVRRTYFAGLGLVQLIAIVSLWSQIHGLIGQDGLLPVTAYFDLARAKLGSQALWRLPSLCWINSGDAMLHVWCAAGAVLAVLLIAGLAPRLVLVLQWAIYLSLTVAGQTFLGFQWDGLLLEMTACSALYAPRGWKPDWRSAPAPLPLARWLLWALAFKLMFLSGVTKLLSGDGTWNDGTALQFHDYTQPIPNPGSWLVGQLPLVAHPIALLLMFLIEVLLPFLVFTGRRGRAVFALASMTLMAVIQATGNFGFFNLQTIVLCIPLLNDQCFDRFVPGRFRRPSVNIAGGSRPPARRMLGNCAAVLVLVASGLVTIREMVRTVQADKVPAFVAGALSVADRSLLSWGEKAILAPISPYRTINGYGLFRVMTIHRTEIVLETTYDGIVWGESDFPYKPGRVDRAPPIVAPHMPRLDWQMWFAALNPRGNEYWLAPLTQRILEGSPRVCRLIGHPEWIRDPPRIVRLSLYEYRFSTRDQYRATGAWWSRTHTGYLTGPLSRRTE